MNQRLSTPGASQQHFVEAPKRAALESHTTSAIAGRRAGRPVRVKGSAILLPVLCLATLAGSVRQAPADDAETMPAPAAAAATDNTTATSPADADSTAHASAEVAAPPSSERVAQTATLIGEAFTVAGRTGGAEGDAARIAAVRGAAALLPALNGAVRDSLTAHWVQMAQSSKMPRAVRLLAYDAFFDGAAHADAAFARRVALALPDAAARAGAFIDLSNVDEKLDWRTSNDDALQAQRAARQEADLLLRARALTFVAYRLAVLNPELSAAAVVEASSQVRLIGTAAVRDNLLAEVVGAASKFDLPMARHIADSISDPHLKDLATARINISEISQTTLSGATSDRIEALARAAVRYDARAIPFLIQLPPQTEVLKALSDALPPLYPSAKPGIDASLLTRMWAYAQSADASVQRDQLQSRLARTMVLYDLWRGRDWGKQLTWKGGRIQVGAFLKAVAAARRSSVKAEPLQDLAERNVNRAIAQARTLSPAARTEATLLIAGQLLS